MTLQNTLPSDDRALRTAAHPPLLTPRLRRGLVSIVLLTALLSAWEGAIRVFDISSLMFPAPSSIALALKGG